MNKNKKIKIYTDGGARGNPGPAAIGVVIEADGIGKKEYSQYIGETTNNDAEYRAVIFAMKKTRQLLGLDATSESELDIYSDSELMVNQLNGEFKIKENNIRNHFLEIWNLKIDFDKVNFYHIDRYKNKLADKLVNQALNREGSKLNL